MFTVNSTTGIIAVSGNLDREDVPGEEVQFEVVVSKRSSSLRSGNYFPPPPPPQFVPLALLHRLEKKI